jgi:hypothetical protein
VEIANLIQVSNSSCIFFVCLLQSDIYTWGNPAIRFRQGTHIFCRSPWTESEYI